jgi:hypothetical protein
VGEDPPAGEEAPSWYLASSWFQVTFCLFLPRHILLNIILHSAVFRETEAVMAAQPPKASGEQPQRSSVREPRRTVSSPEF